MPRWLEGKKVATTRDGLDDPVRLIAQGLPYISDALNQCIVGDEDTGPDCLDQLVLADHPAPIFDKIAQDVEGFWPQLNVIVSAPQRASLQVQRVDVEAHDAWGASRHVLIPVGLLIHPYFGELSARSRYRLAGPVTISARRPCATIEADGRKPMVVSMRSGAATEKGKTSMPVTPPFGDLWSALPGLAAEARARSLEFEERRELASDFADKSSAPAFQDPGSGRCGWARLALSRSGWRSS